MFSVKSSLRQLGCPPPSYPRGWGGRGLALSHPPPPAPSSHPHSQARRERGVGAGRDCTSARRAPPMCRLSALVQAAPGLRASGLCSLAGRSFWEEGDEMGRGRKGRMPARLTLGVLVPPIFSLHWGVWEAESCCLQSVLSGSFYCFCWFREYLRVPRPAGEWPPRIMEVHLNISLARPFPSTFPA